VWVRDNRREFPLPGMLGEIMRYGRRRGPPLKLIGILGGIALVALVGATFWFSGQADKYAPEVHEIRVEAVNVGPQ